MLSFGSFLLPQDSVVHSGQQVLRQQIPLVLDSGQGVGGELGGEMWGGDHCSSGGGDSQCPGRWLTPQPSAKFVLFCLHPRLLV